MWTIEMKSERIIEISVHVLTWSFVFLSPLFFRRSWETFDLLRFLHGSLMQVLTCVAFYVNYFYLIPNYLLKKRNVKCFVIFNLLMFGLSQMIMETSIAVWSMPMPKMGAKGMSENFKHDFPPRIVLILRGFLTFVFTVGVSVALRLSMQWKHSERARVETEAKRSQAELKNLKNQINPHFLLNTLNNIYALVAFDQEKAQQALLELSRLLRYMLYENQSDRVSLSKEIEFLRNYIALMKLRINDDVDVRVEFEVSDNKEIVVAPLIFISLVENAFKHGISPTEHSFIHINLKADHEHLRFYCANSNFPKNKMTDKAPGGIGLKQVASRLELSYPGRYKWTSGISDDEKEYRSEILLTDK